MSQEVLETAQTIQASQGNYANSTLKQVDCAAMLQQLVQLMRERRIAAAKTMLSQKPTASVLSVGLSVGFAAQSSFYEAFREIEGMTPGQYRKLTTSTGIGKRG